MTRLINLRPSRRGRILAGAVPILVLCLVYGVAAALRHADNPADKVLPTVGAMATALWHMGATIDPVTGQVTLLADTLASLTRLGAGLALAKRLDCPVVIHLPSAVAGSRMFAV